VSSRAFFPREDWRTSAKLWSEVVISPNPTTNVKRINTLADQGIPIARSIVGSLAWKGVKVKEAEHRFATRMAAEVYGAA